VVSHGPSLDRFALLAMTAGPQGETSKTPCVPFHPKGAGRRPMLNSH
jgi:hypothetical protein